MHGQQNVKMSFNPLALELYIYSLAHHLCKMWIFYEPRRVTLGNTRHFVEWNKRRLWEKNLKKQLNTFVDWIYQNCTVVSSGTSVLYIGCMVPKG